MSVSAVGFSGNAAIYGCVSWTPQHFQRVGFNNTFRPVEKKKKQPFLAFHHLSGENGKNVSSYRRAFPKTLKLPESSVVISFYSDCRSSPDTPRRARRSQSAQEAQGLRRVDLHRLTDHQAHRPVFYINWAFRARCPLRG